MKMMIIRLMMMIMMIIRLMGIEDDTQNNDENE